MPREHSQELTGGNAIYVLERLVAERRVAQAEISRYLAELPRKIRELEARIRELRGDEGAPKPQPVAKTRKVRRRPARPSPERNGKALGGMYGGLIRRVPAAEQPQFEEIKTREGIAAAVAALRARER
ncbi:MAG: hypothetical protein M3O61_04775 [Gemmatimonadota bacterium]|nr:hypothetical protein [Gemmatimonadota bacterium]